jgi:EAL domain-containing protein (putative c-di-GMP-specific phosphodiesterase class I)/CheY-like chemotaxis protein
MSRKRILVVDDDADVLSVVEAVLSSAGFDTMGAADGSEGIERAVLERPDLVLLDVLMPNLSGWEVCATLRSLPETSSIPVVMLTVKSEIRDFVAGRQAGAVDFVTKPFTRARLVEAVESALAGREDPRSQPLGRGMPERRTHGLLLDSLTGLPTIPVVVDALREKLFVDQDLGVFLIDVDAVASLEDHYGWELLDEVVREAAGGLRRLVGTLFSTSDLLAVSRPGSSTLVAFVALPSGRGEEETTARLGRKARQVEESLGALLGERFLGRVHRRLEVIVSASRLSYNPQVRVERLVERALTEAAAAASSREGERIASQRDEFAALLRQRAIKTVYQPIRDLATGRVVAWEALSRGPAGTGFESPEVLFDYASRHGRVLPLEEICVRFSAARFAARETGLLFVNVETNVVNELARGGLEILGPLVALGPSVVLEITERGAIPDFEAFREGISALRRAGFRIALDDAGSGHASLHAIAELRPDFLKISQSLVTGPHRDGIKSEIVEMLVRLGGRIGAVTVAEGIETEEDLAAVRQLGVALGQGFLLGRPAAVPES